MAASRRALVGGAVAIGSGVLLSPARVLAQDATPVAGGTGDMPTYASAQVHTQPSADLNQAIFPDVMASLLPQRAALPGFHGYVFVFDEADPATAFTLSTFTNEDDARASGELAATYAEELDPRLEATTPLDIDGPVRMYATTARTSAELPPFLHGAVFTLRDQTNAPDVDIENAVAVATETLIPLFQSLPGFILYCWFERPGGRIAINIWETADDLAAASDALVAWREEHFATPTSSEEVAYRGTIGYAKVTGLT